MNALQHMRHLMLLYHRSLFELGDATKKKQCRFWKSSWKVQQTAIRNVIYSRTVNPLRSACNCINKLFRDIDPSALRLAIRKFKDDSNASITSCVWKHMASIAARIRWFRFVNAVNPQIILKLWVNIIILFNQLRMQDFTGRNVPFGIGFPRWCIESIDGRHKVNVSCWIYTGR